MRPVSSAARKAASQRPPEYALYAAHHPGIVGLIWIAAVFWNTAPMIELAEILNKRPLQQAMLRGGRHDPCGR